MKKIQKSFLFITLLLSLLCALSVTGIAAEEKAQTVSKTVTAKNTQEGILLKWSEWADADSYSIYRKNGKGKYKKIGEAEASTPSYTDTSAKSGSKYTYKIAPCTDGKEQKGATSSSLYHVSVPAITELRNVNSGVKITWKKVNGAEKYLIYRKADSDGKWTKLVTMKSGSTYTDTTVKSNTSYAYRIKAQIGGNSSAYDNKSVIALSSPKITNIRNRAKGIELKWTKVEGAEKYIIIRKAAGGKWEQVAKLSNTKQKYLDTSMKSNVRYIYAVKAQNGKASSGFFANTRQTYIPVPQLSSVKNGTDGVVVKWSRVSVATGYKLFRKAENEASWKRIAVLKSGKILTYTDKSAVSGTEYKYTLMVVSGKYQSAYDVNGMSVTYVASPQDVLAKKENKKNVISWDKVEKATDYYVYRKTGTDGKWSKIATVKKNTFTDTKANNEKIYYYRIKAGINSTFYSAYSTQVRSSRIDPNKKMIALTYDDGPSNSSTNRILDVLEKYDAKATFFVIGSRVDSYYTTLQRAHRMGCEIGNHTYTHINLPSYSNSTILSEVNKTNAVVKKYTGEEPTIIRAPGGAANQRVRDCVGMPFIYWSVDTRDWEHRNASKTVASIKNNVRDGSIILMHDIYPATASASESVIPWLIKQGYQLVTVSELMEYRSVKMKSGTTYYNAYKK
ncbi:MAG: polysaccharide deacetylase family protein [Clostridia bacterium]|nr:polysaccharide deacetylase family protein [Clostridia bacterium]